MQKWIVVTTLIILPGISFAQGSLPACIDQAISAADSYAVFEEKSFASVESIEAGSEIQYLVTFKVKSKGNPGIAKYKIELTGDCAEAQVTTISITGI